MFTHNYPYGEKGIFVEQEIGRLAREFEKVVVLPLHKEEGVMFLPDNAEVLFLFEDFERKYQKISWWTKLRWACRKDLIQEVLAHFYKPRARVVQIISNYLRTMLMAEIFIREVDPRDLKNSLCYSFWFDQWVTTLALSKENYIPDLKFVTRAHGFEIFEEQTGPGFHLFRRLQLKYVNKVFSVSGFGRKRLVADNPEFESKIVSLPLGTDDMGIAPFEPEATFTIFSCARILKLKRLENIAAAIGLLDFPVKWVHFGGFVDGQPETGIKFCNAVEGLLQHPNVQVTHIRDYNQKQIMDYYASHHANVFVSASQTEGLPVSIMEALSFGIPVIATDVGGCSELVHEKTGTLISAEGSPEEIAKALSEFRKSEKNTAEFRAGTRQYWEENCRREKVLRQFLDLAEVS